MACGALVKPADGLRLCLYSSNEIIMLHSYEVDAIQIVLGRVPTSSFPCRIS